NRNGQIIIVHNSISELESLQEKIANFVPNHKIQIGHGKMKGKYLEKLLLDFHHHNFDILITTTIIESGIDIPNANTLIVLNAHRFGLSQLYQIRGRVGRSYRKAYAYFILPRNHTISQIATKRLNTLEYYTDLGSGYQIAMQDLEIRGGGNIFGAEQSGHLNKMGFEYFNKILSDEFTTTKNPNKKDVVKEERAEINLQVESHISKNYIENEQFRLEYYRQIGDAKSKSELNKIELEIKDRFGPLPQETQNLLLETQIAMRASRSHIYKILQQTQDEIRLYFDNQVQIIQLQKNIEQLVKNCANHNYHIEFATKKELIGKIKNSGNSALKLLNLVL
ncbi:MAG: TRCF domain-containing protein, partial [Candidatus Marinimicrobia bacterium]|nr:TRCF domain-containing protein [Candidatus Neomarinimicrobiota bacterium]